MLKKAAAAAFVMLVASGLVRAQTEDVELIGGVAPADLAPEEVMDILAQDLMVAGDARMRYFLIGPKEGAEALEPGYSLLIVLPGGSGGEEFLPFVKRIFDQSLTEDYLVAQPVAVKWTPEQEIVWPVAKKPVPDQGFATEEFVDAVIKDVGERHNVNPARVYVLAWSGGGPAAYSASLQRRTLINGSFIAMSAFKPTILPPFTGARGRAYYLYHSPDDEEAPYRKTKAAKALLSASGARVKIVEYEGGHGWRGDVYGAISEGVQWLERATLPEAEPEPVKKEKKKKPFDTFYSESFEIGKKRPKNWWHSGPISSVEYIWDRNVGFESRSSVCLTKFVQKTYPVAYWYREIQYKGTAKKLAISSFIRAKRVAKATIEVAFLDARKKIIESKEVIYVGRVPRRSQYADHNWKQYVGAADIPKGTKKIRFELRMHGSGMVWFDKFEAGYVAGGAEPEPNPQRR
ncbi:MAG: alpha/beta hydrolase [Planctomycetota bacterium]|jgi:predicted esterase